MIKLNSSNLDAASYNIDSNELIIKFKGGGVYLYYEVPEGVFRGLLNSSSKGSYHHHNIKYSYDYVRIN